MSDCGCVLGRVEGRNKGECSYIVWTKEGCVTEVLGLCGGDKKCFGVVLLFLFPVLVIAWFCCYSVLRCLLVYSDIFWWFISFRPTRVRQRGRRLSIGALIDNRRHDPEVANRVDDSVPGDAWEAGWENRENNATDRVKLGG